MAQAFDPAINRERASSQKKSFFERMDVGRLDGKVALNEFLASVGATDG